MRAVMEARLLTQVIGWGFKANERLVVEVKSEIQSRKTLGLTIWHRFSISLLWAACKNSRTSQYWKALTWTELRTCRLEKSKSFFFPLWFLVLANNIILERHYWTEANYNTASIFILFCSISWAAQNPHPLSSSFPPFFFQVNVESLSEEIQCELPQLLLHFCRSAWKCKTQLRKQPPHFPALLNESKQVATLAARAVC